MLNARLHRLRLLHYNIMTTRVKICGLKDASSLRVAVDAGAAFVGFVYYPASPRHIGLVEAAKLKALLPSYVQCVCVLVDADDVLLAAVRDVLSPDWVQLHGSETPERVKAVRDIMPARIGVIKALRVRSSDDVAQAAAYTTTDMLLFDAKAPEGMLPGGNGLSFDWALLRGREFHVPWMLSGGLHAENVGQAVGQTGARMVDVSSGVEAAPGVKDATLIQAFMKAVESHDQS